jgi:hypothetical protein
MKRDLRSEADIAAPVVQYFEDHGWLTYQEIQIGRGGRILDLACVLEPQLAIVEVKKALSLDLLAQAAAWLQSAHYVWIAFGVKEREGRKKHDRGRLLAERICKALGIGFLTVKPSGDVLCEFGAKLHRKARVQDIRKYLDDEHRAYCKAGSRAGRRWTPWLATCEKVIAYVKEHPGCTFKEVFASVKSHYASPNSANGAMSKLLQRGLIAGLRFEVDPKNAFRLYAT